MNETMGTAGGKKINVGLAGVPETMLVPLWNRSAEVGRADALINDPLSADLVRRIDYDFRGRFGEPNATHAIRARVCDDLVRSFMARHPGAPVVALGEGLETQFWRVDDGSVPWVSVDLPEAISARRQLLPEHPRNIAAEGSAFDTAWFEAVPKGGPVFVSAAGLFMYFERAQVVDLLRALVRHFGQGELFFDTIPPWFSRKTLKGWSPTRFYTFPPMPFALSLAALDDFTAEVPGLSVISALTYAEPFPRRMPFFALLSRVRMARDHMAPGLIHLRFG